MSPSFVTDQEEYFAAGNTSVTEQEEDLALSPSIVRSIIESERSLYPSLFHDDNNTSHSEPGEDNKANAENLAVCNIKTAETVVKPSMEANVAQQVEAPHHYDNNASGDLICTSTTPPSTSCTRSNPDSPTERPEMSFDAKPVGMAGNLSEQSPLAPRMTRYANSELEARPSSQGQNRNIPSAVANAPRSRAGTPRPRSRVGSVSGVSSPLARPQAGPSPEQINGYEPAARFSNVRQNIGPSGLRNSISAPSENQDRPISSSGQQYPPPVQANVVNSSMSDQMQSHGSQYQHGYRSQSPQLWIPDQHASPYKGQIPIHNNSNSMVSFTTDDHFSNIFATHSPHNLHTSQFGEDQSHGIMTHETVNPPQYQNELLLQQAATYLPYTTQPLHEQRRTSNFDQVHFQNMNMKPEGYLSEARQSRLKYQSLEDARREKSVSVHNPLVDHTIPQTDEDDCHYVERMVEAMLDMSVAEDNSGMVRTWESMKRDVDKVERAAWEILVSLLYLIHSFLNATYLLISESLQRETSTERAVRDEP